MHSKIAVLAALAATAYGHGYMTIPKSREAQNSDVS